MGHLVCTRLAIITSIPTYPVETNCNKWRKEKYTKQPKIRHLFSAVNEPGLT